jgi:cytosine/uracil/thiamine/allantoin permease
MKISERTRKSREVHAENLLKVSTSLVTAFFITILIVPIGAILKSMFEPTGSITLKGLTVWLFSIKVWIFILCEIGVAKVAFSLRKKALDIYDELYPDEH